MEHGAWSMELRAGSGGQRAEGEGQRAEGRGRIKKPVGDRFFRDYFKSWN